MNLQNLPPEIIYIICEAFCPHCTVGGPRALRLATEAAEFWRRRDTLLSLCLLCKSWADIAQRILFHIHGYENESAQVGFCRTIFERPELGRSVRWSILNQISRLDGDLEKDDDSWLFKALEKFSNILNLPPAPYKLSIGARLSFIAPLILLQVRNATYLNMHPQGLDHLMQQFRKPYSSHVHTFPQSIVKITMLRGPNSHAGPVDLSDTAGGVFLSNIPSAKKLSLGDPIRQTIKSSLQLHNVRDLHLSGVCLGREELRLLVSATGPLEIFRYHGRRADEPNPATGQDICQVLMMKKDTLAKATILTPYNARRFTAARSLENITWLSIAVRSIWTPTRSELTLHEQAWVAAFPPNLSTIFLHIWAGAIEGLSNALTTYILSKCPDSPEDQVLKYVEINIDLGRHPEGMPNLLSTPDYPTCEKIKQKCALFLERGEMVVMYYYRD